MLHIYALNIVLSSSYLYRKKGKGMLKQMIKGYKKVVEMNWAIRKSYHDDCSEFLKWQYNNPNLKTKDAYEARILRQAHILEKGMSLSKPKKGFGVKKALELLEFIVEYQTNGYHIAESQAVINSLGVLSTYVEFHKKRGFLPSEVENELEKYSKFIPKDREKYGVIETSFENIQQLAQGNFRDFFCSRHSIRQFSEEPVTDDEINKAVSLAMHAPSACNRQSVKVYFYRNEEINKDLGNLIAGNTGFEKDASKYVVVTSDISAFYESFERNQMYVDGGIFALALAEAFHYYGIASCILQNGESTEKNMELRKVCKNIPQNEKIILFLAIGHYPKHFTYASSHRKKLQDVLIVK